MSEEHAKLFEPKVRDIQERLRKMSKEDCAGRLLQITHQPPWTTPREVKLVQAALDAHSRQLDAVEHSLRQLVEGAE